MNKKNKDPYPITDVYHVTDTLVDAATVVVTDLCENLSNSIDTHCDDILENLKKINTKKFNSISVGNSADGIYPVWVGVDKLNKVRKIFANTNGGSFDFDREKTKKLVSWSWNKGDLNDQFFLKSNKNKNVKRQRLFDMEIKSGAVAIADHGGHFRFEHHDAVIESLNEKYFKINNIYQNNYPIGLFIFNYGNKEVSSASSFKSSKIHDEKVVNISNFKSLKYTEFLSNLLDEKCYPTKYIFEKYLVEEKDYEDKIQIKIRDEKISANYLSDRLPKALQILKNQNKILFGKNFQEVHEIRKSQFENFIISIIKDIEPQELNLPTFGKKKSKIEIKNNKLYVETTGLPYIQETFYDGYKLKSEPSLLESATVPVKNGKYPCYIHSFADEADEDGFQYDNVYVVVEGLENCYLNRNSKGQIFFDKSFKESLFLKEHINKKSKNISIDKIDLRNSENLKELEKISFVEELELHGFQNIKNWDGLSKLKKLKKLKLVSCDISFSTTENFFKNLYSLTNLEEFTIDDTCRIPIPNKSKFPKNLYLNKLKSFKIDFREEWKKGDYENNPNHKGYCNEKVWFISTDLPNIYEFPNFEKFKSLEKLRIYNYFDSDQKEGRLFNYEYEFQYEHSKISKFCSDYKVKDIWIYGYNFDKVEELANTRFLELSLKMIGDSNVKINGIKKETFNNVVIENATSLVILDDNCGYNSSKIINDIQIFKTEDFEGLEDGQLPLLNGGKLTFPIKKLGKEDYNPLKYFFNLENLFEYSSWANTLRKENNYNHFIDDDDYEKSLIFVKKSFLDKSKKVIFNNIKHLYYYCIRKMVGEESLIFWNKNERFKIPDSIKINNLETLHLSCGRKTSFKDLEKACGATLKFLIVDDMLVDDFSMPKMPKLEKMLINYGHVDSNVVKNNNKKFTNFRKFENVPSLNQLDLDIESDCENGIELGTLKENNNIKSLKIHHLNPKYVNEIVKIKSLSELDISLWDEKNKVTEKTFEFLKDLKNLKKLELSGGGHGTISIDYKKMMTFINKNIEDLKIDIVYKEDNHKVVYNCLVEINNRFRKLKKLRLEWHSCFIDVYERFNSEVDFAPFKFKEDKEVLEYSNKKTKLKSTHDKYKFQLDFKYLNRLKNLELIGFNKNYKFKTTIINENELFKLPKLTRIVSDADLFSKNFFKNIKKRQDDFLNKCKKLKKYKSLSSEYDLEGDEWNQYGKLRIKIGYGYYGKEADEILKERKKKKPNA